jgi:DNA repair exonuclease SbcCD nuclease subunit
MKVALLTDLHFGVNQDNIAFLENNKKFLENVFFPTIDEQNIDHVICLGDVLHRRKYVNYLTATYLQRDFFKPLMNRTMDRDLRFDWILGNHDLYYREETSVSAAHVLNHYGHVHREADTISLVDKEDNGYRVCYIPWICKENREQVMKHIEDTDAEIAFAHLELAGFYMNKDYIKIDGDDPNLFQKFEKVYSGHYHHPSKQDNIHYLGAFSQQNWVDYDDPRGFHILDLKTQELQFFPNPHEMYAKIWYDDSKEGLQGGQGLGDWADFDLPNVKGKNVKVIVTSKNIPARFDLFISKIEEMQPMDIIVVDDHLNFNLNEDEHIINESNDTLTIIRDFVKQANDVVNVGKLDNLIVDLYNKANEGSVDD